MAIALVAVNAPSASPDPTTNSNGFAQSDRNIETWGWLVAQQEEVAGIEVNSPNYGR